MDEIGRFKLTDLDRFKYRTGVKVMVREEYGEWCSWDKVAPRLQILIDIHKTDVSELGRLRKELQEAESRGILYG